MPLTAVERQGIIEDLTTNCDCWKLDKHPGSVQILNGLPDEQLASLKADLAQKQQAFLIANKAIDGFKVGDKHVKLNRQTNKWEAAIVDNANPATPPTPPAQTPPPKVPKTPVTNTTQEEDDEEEAVANRRRNKRIRTIDELIRSELVDPALQEQINNIRQVEMKEKQKVVEQLLTNVAPGDRRVHYDRLMLRPLNDLYNDLAIMPRASQASPDTEAEAARRVVNDARRRQQQNQDDDMLVAPSSYQELDSNGQVRNGDQQAQANNATRQSTNSLTMDYGVTDDSNIEDELARLSPKARQLVQNAQVIEAREKRELIAQLTADIMDEAEEKRVNRTFNALSVEQLRDLTVGLRKGSRSGGQGSGSTYFGGNTPSLGTAVNNARHVAGDDDILELPRMPYAEDSAMKKFQSA
jgi:hypothetical protein